MTRINLECLRPWIVKRITELLNFEDEVVCDYVFNQLEERHPDPKDIQINITGFLNSKNARIFLTELWDLLLSAMESPDGIPSEILTAKKSEIVIRQQQESRAKEELQRKDDFKGNRKIVLTTQLAATLQTGLPQKHEQAASCITPREAATGCEVSANASLTGQNEKLRKAPSASKRDRRRRSRSTSCSSSSSSSRSSASSDYRRRRRRRRHNRRHRKRSRSRSDQLAKKRPLPETDWRKDLMAGRRRSPPQMPECSYYGNEKQDKQHHRSRDNRPSRDGDDRNHGSRNTCADVGRDGNVAERSDARPRQTHHRRRYTESSASPSGDDTEWRNRSPKPAVFDHGDDGVVSRRHRPREVCRGHEFDYSRGEHRARERNRDGADYRATKHANDWMYEAEEMVVIRENNDGLMNATASPRARPSKKHQHGMTLEEPSLPIVSLTGDRELRAPAVKRDNNNSMSVHKKVQVEKSQESSSSSSSSSGSESDDASTSSDTSTSSASSGDKNPVSNVVVPTDSRKQSQPRATAIPRQRVGAPTRSPEGPSLPLPVATGKQRKILPEGPGLPPKAATLVSANGRAMAGAADKQRGWEKGREELVSQGQLVVNFTGDNNKKSGSSSSSGASSESSSESESESSSSDNTASETSGSESSSSGTSNNSGNEKAGDGIERPQPQQARQQPFSLPEKRRRAPPPVVSTSPEGPAMPPQGLPNQSRESTEKSRRNSNKRPVDKDEEALRRRALASMLRASTGDRL